MMGGYGGYGGWGMGLFHGVFWLIILGLIVWAVIAFVRSNPGHFSLDARDSRRSKGLELLEERYARGEIEREEYLQKKQDLAR